MLGVLAPSASPDSADVAALSNDDLFDAYEAQRREIRRREARSAVLLAEIERRRCFEPYGYLSAASYVAHRAGDSHRAAAGRVRTARALGDMPHTAAAFADGDIDPVRVRRLVDARDAAPESFPAAEERLVDQARRLDAKDFTSAVEMWRRRAVPRVIATEERERFERRRLSISDSFDGLVHLEGDLDPVSGEVVITAIRSVASPANRDNTDGRTPTQRRVDALTEICRAHLDSGVAPVSGGVKPHLDVIVDLDTLHQGAHPTLRDRGETGTRPRRHRVLCLRRQRLPDRHRRPIQDPGHGAAGPAPPPPPSSAPSPSATADASSPAAAGLPHGAMPTTSSPGSKAGSPTSTKCASSADPTT